MAIDPGPYPLYDVTTLVAIVKYLNYIYLFRCHTTVVYSIACRSNAREPTNQILMPSHFYGRDEKFTKSENHKSENHHVHKRETCPTYNRETSSIVRC